MKQIILSIIVVLAAISVNAQTVNVHLKDGQTIRYNSSEVDYVDFSEKSSEQSDNPATEESVTASFIGGAIMSNNDRILSGSQLNVKFSNNTKDNVTLTEMHLIDSETKNEGNNLLSEKVNVPAGESVAYTIRVGALGIYKPIIRFTYIRNKKTLTVEAQWSDWSPSF